MYMHMYNYNVYVHIVYVHIMHLPKTKKFDRVGRGDLTFLFKSCEIDKSHGRLVY